MSCHSRLSAALIAPLLIASSAHADDWPQWRGPDRNAQSSESGLLDSWPEDGPPLDWQASGVGAGYASLSVADGMIYTLGDLDDGSYLIALEEKSGKPAWKTKLGEAGGHKKYPGPRGTPTVDGGEVFAMNQFSDLACFDAKTGKAKWSVNLADEFGGKMMSGWKFSESPLVDGDQVVCTPGGKEGTVLALDRATGKKRWQTEGWTDAAGYSSIVIAEIHGVRQYVQLTGNSVAGIAPESGKILWKADRAGKTAVISTPVIADDIVFVTSSYGVGCNGFKITKTGDGFAAEEIYANKEIANHHGGVVLLDGHVFGSSGGTFRCLEVETGELAFADRSVGKGATIFADGHLYLRGENGGVALIEATPEKLVEKSRFNQPDRTDEPAWSHPVIANGKLYLKDQDLLLCYDISGK